MDHRVNRPLGPIHRERLWLWLCPWNCGLNFQNTSFWNLRRIPSVWKDLYTEWFYHVANTWIFWVQNTNLLSLQSEFCRCTDLQTKKDVTTVSRFSDIWAICCREINDFPFMLYFFFILKSLWRSHPLCLSRVPVVLMICRSRYNLFYVICVTCFSYRWQTFYCYPLMSLPLL